MMKLSFSIVLLSSLLGVFATTPDQVRSDVKSLISKTNKLSKSIRALKSPNDLKSAWASITLLTADIHYAARSLLSDADVATENLKAVTSQPVSPSYGLEALSLGQGLQDSIVTALGDAVAQHDTVAAIPVPGATSIVRKDLEDLKTKTGEFQQVLLAAADDTTRPPGMAMVNNVNTAFDRAIAAYSA